MAAFASLFATSCQNEIDSVSEGKTSVVSFNVGASGISSRAFSDGETATKLEYAVYKVEGENLTELTDLTVEDAAALTMENKKQHIELQLTTGNVYAMIFWAAAEGAPYEVNFANKTMTVDYSTAVSNDEIRDAFYAYVEPFTVSGSETKTIELKRPFAQLNIGTNDLAASTSAGYTVTQTYVKVPVYNTLNMVNGTVAGPETIEFGWANIPSNETFPVSGYEYLAMNYLLVQKETVDLTFGYAEGVDAEGNPVNAKTRTVGSVPVERNHRTNIYGQLLTSNVDINVEIKPGFEDPALEPDALQHAAAFGGVVTLTEDVTLSAPLNVQVNMSLNLAGYTLNGALNLAEGVSLTVEGGNIVNTNSEVSGIESWGNLTLNNVNITSARHAVRIENGTAVINGGTYGVEATSGMTQHALNVSGNSKVTVKGGTFVGPNGTAADSGTAVNVQAGATVTIEGGDFSGGKTKTLQNKGTLNIIGGIFDQEPTAAEGYGVKEANGKYYVVTEDVAEIEGTVVTTADELNAALADNTVTSILLMEGEYADVFVAKDNKTIIGTPNANVYCVALNSASNFTLKNVHFDAANAKGSYNGKGARIGWANIVSATEEFKTTGASGLNIVIEGCTFTGKFANGGEAIAFTNQYRLAYGKVTITNCTFETEGAYYDIYNYYAGMNDLVIENNTFNSECLSTPIFLGRYSSNMPVQVIDNTFNTVASLQEAIYLQAHGDSYTVSINAENNTFAE